MFEAFLNLLYLFVVHFGDQMHLFQSLVYGICGVFIQFVVLGYNFGLDEFVVFRKSVISAALVSGLLVKRPPSLFLLHLFKQLIVILHFVLLRKLDLFLEDVVSSVILLLKGEDFGEFPSLVPILLYQVLHYFLVVLLCEFGIEGGGDLRSCNFLVLVIQSHQVTHSVSLVVNHLLHHQIVVVVRNGAGRQFLDMDGVSLFILSQNHCFDIVLII